MATSDEEESWAVRAGRRWRLWAIAQANAERRLRGLPLVSFDAAGREATQAEARRALRGLLADRAQTAVAPIRLLNLNQRSLWLMPALFA